MLILGISASLRRDSWARSGEPRRPLRLIVRTRAPGRRSGASETGRLHDLARCSSCGGEAEAQTWRAAATAPGAKQNRDSVKGSAR